MEQENKYGYNKHRLKRDDDYHTLEVAFADTFNEEFGRNWNNLASIVNNPEHKSFLTEEEEKAVLSTIQWLGTPVGQGFLERVNKKVKENGTK